MIVGLKNNGIALPLLKGAAPDSDTPHPHAVTGKIAPRVSGSLKTGCAKWPAWAKKTAHLAHLSPASRPAPATPTSIG
jgi:hypothetical protein